MIMDTGSANLWVLSSDCELPLTISNCQRYCENDVFCDLYCPLNCCQNGGGADNSFDRCYGRPRFYADRSNSFKPTDKTFRIIYGTGSAAGAIGTDIVRLADLAIPSTDVGLANDIDEFLANDIADGIFGLGFPRLARGDVIPPLIRAAELGIVEPLFTVWLDRKGANVYGSLGGEITYGGVDTVHCEPTIVWEPLTRAMYWQFRVRQFNVIGSWMSENGGEAISDTGTSFIGLPTRAMTAVRKRVALRYSQMYGYLVDCAAKITLEFDIGGNLYSVAEDQLILEANSAGGLRLCILAVFEIPDDTSSPDFILGDPFIRTYCHVHDMKNERIGFARAL